MSIILSHVRVSLRERVRRERAKKNSYPSCTSRLDGITVNNEAEVPKPPCERDRHLGVIRISLCVNIFIYVGIKKRLWEWVRISIIGWLNPFKHVHLRARLLSLSALSDQTCGHGSLYHDRVHLLRTHHFSPAALALSLSPQIIIPNSRNPATHHTHEWNTEGRWKNEVIKIIK